MDREICLRGLICIKGEKEINEAIYDKLYGLKSDIELDYGSELKWQRLDDKKSCRISLRIEEVDVRNVDDWEKIIQFYCSAMPRFYNALHNRLNKIVKEV